MELRVEILSCRRSARSIEQGVIAAGTEDLIMRRPKVGAVRWIARLPRTLANHTSNGNRRDLVGSRKSGSVRAEQGLSSLRSYAGVTGETY